MRLSHLADYAVVLMTAAARRPAGARLSATELSSDTGVPLPTTQKLMGQLAGCGAPDMVDEGDLVPRQRMHQIEGLSGEGHLLNWRTATHGATHDEAARHGREVLEMLIEGAQEEGKPLPAPLLFARTA